MSNKFISSLWSATSPSVKGRLKDLVLTVPPAIAGSEFTITLTTTSGVTLGSVTTPTGVTWASPTLTVGPTFTGTGKVTLTLTGAKVATTFFSITLAPGTAKTGTSSTVQVDEYGWMVVTSLGSDVDMKGLYFLVQEIPSAGGRLKLHHPLVLVPSVTGATDFSFQVSPGSGLSGGTLSLSATSGVTVSGTTATVQSSLSGGSSASVTATYTPTAGNPTTGIFTVQRLSNGNAASGSASSVRLNSDESFTATSLDSQVFLRGVNAEYQTTTPGNYDLLFHTAPSGLQFDTPPVVWNPGGTAFKDSKPADNTVCITSTNTAGSKELTDFDLRTNLGDLDPTIINNPDT